MRLRPDGLTTAGLTAATKENSMPDHATHVTLDPAGVLRTLVLQEPDHPDITLTLRGTAPETLQYNGRIWAATHHRLHRPMARNGYQYTLLQPPKASPEHP